MRRACADVDQIRIEPLHALDPGRPEELGRADRHDARRLLDQGATLRLVPHEQLDRDLADPARQHPRSAHLRVVDVQQLAAQRAQLGRAQRDLLDDAREPGRLDHDRVADREPALELHEEAGQDVDQEALQREAQQHDDQRCAGQRAVAAEPRDLEEHEQGSEPVGGIAHRGLDERDERLTPLQGDHHLGRRSVLADGPLLVAADDPLRDLLGEPRHHPRCDEREHRVHGDAPRLGDEVELDVVHSDLWIDGSIVEPPPATVFRET